MTQLALKQLVKRFGDVTAVKGISLEVAPGSLVALLGPSGCGKTTTLRMIAGLEQPSEGDICFNDESVLHLAPDKRNIGMVFQRYVLFPHMTVEKNISFGLRMRGVAAAEIAKQVTEMLDIVQLRGLERRFPSQLSGGQQQRVAIARTVITNPRLMLMDEPLSNLDAKLREEMRRFISDLQHRLSLTTVFVTHDQLEAIELADTIGVMFDGQLVQVGTPEDIFNHPQSTQVADFMGATNFFSAKIVAKDARTAQLESGMGQLLVRQAIKQAIGSKVTVTIRPEHIHMHASQDGHQIDTNAEHDNAIKGRIDEAIYYGGSVTYHVQTSDLGLQVRDLSTRRFNVGEEVSLRLAREHLWVFPDV